MRWSADIGVGSLTHRAGLKTALIVAPVTHPHYGHRLRRPSGVHNAPIQNMQDSHSAKAPFGALHIPNKALCKVAYAGNCRVPAPWHQSGATRIVLVSGLRPVVLCVPPPTLGPGRCAAWPARSARPPPKGAPSARAKTIESGADAPLRQQTSDDQPTQTAYAVAFKRKFFEGFYGG